MKTRRPAAPLKLEKIQARFTEDEAAKLHELAVFLDMTPSQIIRRAVRIFRDTVSKPTERRV